MAVLDGLVTTLGRRPQHIRMDNGPELTAHALADWCRLAGADPVFIDPGSPWQNGVCESFNGRFRDEFLACEQFNTLLEVQVLAEDWRIEYNTYRPHGSLDGLTPGGIPRAVDEQSETALIAGGPRTGAQSRPLSKLERFGRARPAGHALCDLGTRGWLFIGVLVAAAGADATWLERGRRPTTVGETTVAASSSASAAVK